MGARSTYPLADRVLGGTLAKRLKRWRTEGLSFESIAHLLRDEDIPVTGETVRQWCLKIDAAA